MNLSKNDQLIKDALLFICVRENKPVPEKIVNITNSLRDGANIDACDLNDDGNTCLHIAVARNEKSIVELLISEGAHLVSNSYGKTQIDLAEEKQHFIGSEMLLLLSNICKQANLTKKGTLSLSAFYKQQLSYDIPRKRKYDPFDDQLVTRRMFTAVNNNDKSHTNTIMETSATDHGIILKARTREKTYSVWNSKQKESISISASCLNDLQAKISKAWDQPTDNIKIVLKIDGTLIDTETQFETLPSSMSLVALVENEEWMSKKLYMFSNLDQTIQMCTVASSLDDLLAIVSTKLNQPVKNLTLVLESDGTVINNEKSFSRLSSYTALVVLIDKEQWKPVKQFIISDAKRLKSSSISALSLDDFLKKVSVLWGKSAKSLSIVLESNGKVIDDEKKFSKIDSGTELMVLDGNEKWLLLKKESICDVNRVSKKDIRASSLTDTLSKNSIKWREPENNLSVKRKIFSTVDFTHNTLMELDGNEKWTKSCLIYNIERQNHIEIMATSLKDLLTKVSESWKLPEENLRAILLSDGSMIRDEKHFLLLDSYSMLMILIGSETLLPRIRCTAMLNTYGPRARINTYAVCNADHEFEFIISVSSFCQLIYKIHEKLSFPKATLKVVLKSDGTEIRRSSFLSLPSFTPLMILEGNRKWLPAGTINPSKEKEQDIRTFNICDVHRNKYIRDSSVLSYQDLIEVASESLGLPADNLKIVLDSDGTEVDEEYFLTLEPNASFMVLHGGETWSPNVKKWQFTVDQTDEVNLENRRKIEGILKRLQENVCEISLLDDEDLELITDMNLDSFVDFRKDEQSTNTLELIKEAAGRLLLEKREAQHAMELLNLYNEALTQNK